MTSCAIEKPDVRAWAPGRIEIAGNHVDHQGGRVIAAAIDRGIEVRVRRNSTGTVSLSSEGFDDVHVRLDDLAPRGNERQTTQALVRGVLAGCAAAGIPLEGFDAQAISTLPAGGGLSSSAAFELALAAAVCGLSGSIPDPIVLARIGQAAERGFFGKPCGLMDQMASVCGGMTLMDFENEAAPRFERIDCDLTAMGLAACIVDVGAGHGALAGSYARIPDDMAGVARLLGAERLRDVDEDDLLSNLDAIREEAGDLAVLRALHFFNEMRLVDERTETLRAGDAQSFLEATRRSAASSAQLLQNIDAPGEAQPTMMALALADLFLGRRGAARIHGGGFGGSIEAFVPATEAEAFSRHMERHIGLGCCTIARICTEGAGAVALE